ncbi:ChaN family lipoprotein|uniref:ChaN family lipoprotein n=1 Tax=Noviherbaspirillum sp. L7-7A TaxID=2850560 RepID=UPI001C2BF90C|nr:ChaN family lipoprotein [Noviherbaspirillum sp. L7-7A]MBV0879426.1 ChaN family lipoprotein [Noviherbaspirillum sp. L7-7A]
MFAAMPILTPSGLSARRLLLGSLLAACLMIQAGCGAIQAASSGDAGQPWKVSDRRHVPFSELAGQARAADIVLLGETHDNPAHHATQRRLLESLADRKPALVMEQFDLEQQASLDTILRSGGTRQEKLQALKTLMKPGWEWPGYEGLLATALERGLPVLAANISREALREVSRNGVAALGDGASAQLGLDTGWSAAQQASLRQDVVAAHCGMLPEAAVGAMVNAQRVRDAIMADRLLSAPGSAVAILGRGHVRQDLAVPVYLRQRAPQKKVLSVALAEGELDPEAPQPYDYVIPAKAVSRAEDPCAELAAQKPGPAAR